jgi:phage terminase large subunit-like protein
VGADGVRRRGLAEVPDGDRRDTIDHRFIRDAFKSLGKVFTIKEVGYDPHGASRCGTT